MLFLFCFVLFKFGECYNLFISVHFWHFSLKFHLILVIVFQLQRQLQFQLSNETLSAYLKIDIFCRCLHYLVAIITNNGRMSSHIMIMCVKSFFFSLRTYAYVFVLIILNFFYCSIIWKYWTKRIKKKCWCASQKKCCNNKATTEIQKKTNHVPNESKFFFVRLNSQKFFSFLKKIIFEVSRMFLHRKLYRHK